MKHARDTVMWLVPRRALKRLIRCVDRARVGTTTTRRVRLAPRRRYALADLIAQCDPSAPEPAELVQWGQTRPIGREEW